VQFCKIHYATSLLPMKRTRFDHSNEEPKLQKGAIS